MKNYNRKPTRASHFVGCLLLIHGGYSWGYVYPKVTGVQMINNTCDGWEAQVKYTAAEIEPGEPLDRILAYTYFDHTSHLHALYDRNTYITYFGFKSNTFEDRLKEINKEVFNVEEPQVGRSATHRAIHTGICAADVGESECVGLFLGRGRDNEVPRHGKPDMFPTTALCWKVGGPTPTCTFDTSALTIKHGNIGIDKEDYKTTSLRINCTTPTTHTVSIEGGGSQITGNGATSVIDIGGKALPVQIKGKGAHDVTIGSRLRGQVAGDVNLNSTLIIDVW